MKITISGTAGSGKSTIAKKIATKYNLKHYSMGDLQRELAKERGLTIKEWGNLEKSDSKYDQMIDNKQEKIGKEEDNFIIDGWTSAKFVPHAIKIFLDANIDVRAKRRESHSREEEKFDNIKDAKKDMQEREQINHDRYMKFYNYDYRDKNNYDIVVDTSELNIEKVLEKVILEIEKVK